ncbi:MAG: aldehyde dehydrogenase family protein [Nitrospinae bacterium]|nr:aldehyde dehydrogenase family protein [Nitrospinota bacterium]
MIIKGQNFIGGEWRSGGKPFPVINPYNGQTIAEIADATPADIEDITSSAVKGAAIMETLPAHKRYDILQKTSLLIEERGEEIARTITAESGKGIKDSKGEVSRAVQTFRFAAEESKRIEGSTIPMDAVAGSEDRIAFYQPFPVGVVLAITPFNFPLNLVAHKVAPAIASGNAVILKPSPKTPLTAIKLVEILLDSGLPPEGINLVNSSGNDIGEALVAHPKINMISFTGSLPVGLKIKAASGMKRVALELGSNSACIVEPDSDIDLAVTRSVAGAFAYAGQVCVSLQRIYLNEKIYDEFLSKFIEVVKRVKVGDPVDPATDYGPLISDREKNRCISWLGEAEEGGAIVEYGGVGEDGTILPTVLTGVKGDMKVVCGEVFAPVVSLIRYNEFSDAIDMVNDSEYGLQAGVFTKDIGKALTAFKKLKVGGVIINDIPTYRADHMPYGGVKNSGLGREGVRFAIEEMTEIRVLVMRG